MLVLLQEPPWWRQTWTRAQRKQGNICLLHFLLEFIMAFLLMSLSIVSNIFLNTFLFTFLSGTSSWKDLSFLHLSFLHDIQNEVKLCKDPLSVLPPCVLKRFLKCLDELYHMQGPRRVQKFQKQMFCFKQAALDWVYTTQALPNFGPELLLHHFLGAVISNRSEWEHFSFLCL